MVKKERWPLSLKEVHGIDECVDGLPVVQNGGDDDETEDEEKLPRYEREDEWTDYADEPPSNLQEVP